ncbi:hypothetical protein BD289DRAFT_453098 [Coniella lustricola]|uniref:C2H2-type domain-containing protein n=1 Tax=Coniella lustricola TaxID=2025994 RepID=A0A2T3A8M9_9PEZI|nr:hypothetical protein BD289DRAFT_453098 [Coniella lustricola]
MAVGDMNHSSIEAVQTRLEQNAEAWIKLIEGMQENSIAEASQHTEWKNIIASILGQPFAVCASTDLDKKNRHFDSEIYADGEASVMCYEWQWLTADTDLSPRPSVPPSLAVLETQMVEHLRQSYQAQSEKQNSTPPPVPSSTSSSSSMSDDRKSSSSRKTSRRDIETPSDVYDHGPSVKKGRKLIPPGEIRLACHFQKRNPERYPACGIRKNGFRTVAEIKQHFWRNHQQNPNYCPRCKASFDTAQLKDDHVRQAFVTPCPESAANIPEGLSHELCTVLKRRVDKECDLFEQWFSIWDIIFPEIPRPDNPMFDLCDDVHIQTLDLAAFLETEGPGVVTSMLREEGYLSIGEPGTQLASPGVVLCQAADHKETNISPDFAIDFDNTNDMPWYAGTWDEGNDGFQFRSY